MFHIDSADTVQVMPPPSNVLNAQIQFFQEGNPRTGKEATILSADWLNMVQMELLNIIQAVGLSPEKNTYDQVLKAIRLLVVTTFEENVGDIIGNLPAGAYFPEADTFALRNTLGCTQVNDPKVAKDAANKGWVEANFSPKTIQGLFTGMAILTASTTYTAPNAGVYKVTVIGGGGAGGNGGYAYEAGVGGKQGGTTSFGSLLSAIGGSGGGGGAGSKGGSAGGGGGAGEIRFAYVTLTKNQAVQVTVGAGAPRATATSSASNGGNGEGPSGGRGGKGYNGGGGAAGAGNGSNNGVLDYADEGVGGAGGVNGTPYGGGGGGCSGIDMNTPGAAAGGAEYGGSFTGDANRYGGKGGNGAVFIEYFKN